MANETTSKLTMIARGLGFEETAKSADVLAQAQQRLLDNQGKLAAAQQSGSIGDVGKLTDEQQKLTSVIDALGGAQERDNLRKQDYLKLLREINPQLAGFVDAGLSAVKVSGRLAQEQVSLTGVMGAAKNAVMQYAGAFGLLAAGGAVLLGINAIAKAWQKVTEETQRATDAVKAQNEAYDATLRSRRELQASIENIADRRREGGFTVAESETARDAAARVRKRFPQLDEGAVATAAALLPGADDQAIAEAAFLQQSGRLQLDPKRPAQSRRKAFEQSRRRGATDVATFIAREAAQRASLRAALDEAQGRSGTTLNLEDFVSSVPGDAFAGREVPVARAIPIAAEFESMKQELGDLFKHRLRRAGETEDQVFDSFARGKGARIEDALDAREALRLLVRAVEGMSGQPTIVQNNGRYIGADAASRKARTVNGESQRVRIERE